MTAYVDFRFASNGDLADLGGPASRFSHNITAIKLLKSLEIARSDAFAGERLSQERRNRGRD
jgi:hypothetical protein